MRSVLVYESMFGNTRDVAEAVATGLRRYGEVVALPASEAPLTIRPRIGLLLVGAPTHQFGLSTETTRAEAVRRSPDGHLVAGSYGIREWLAALHRCVGGIPAATFDTRVGTHLVLGSAAARTHRSLQRRGFDMVARPQSFWVQGVTGPMRDGELVRAQEWGAALGRKLARASLARS